MATRAADGMIRESRLLVSRPEVVYVELEKYGQTLKGDRYAGDDDLEKNLLGRNDRLIDLGLAQHCHDKDVWKTLYLKSQAAAKGLEERYLKGLRLACLSNENAAGLLSRFPYIDPPDLAKLIHEGPGDEVHVLINNPSIHEELLEQLYKHEGPFAQLDDDRWRRLVYSSAENPRLVNDTSDEHGPDLNYNDIRDAIRELLGKAPVNWQWLDALLHLHVCLMKGKNESSGVDITDITKRWEALEAQEDKEEREGYFGGATQKEEFIAIVSAMYGRHFYKSGEKYESNIVGSLDSPGLSHRCAYYGNGKLTRKDMEKAHERDGDTYVLAALCNEDLYLDRALRAVLENQITFRQRWLYTSKCEEIASRKSYFDPRPVSDDLIGDDEEKPAQTSNELTAIKALEGTVKSLEARLASHRSLILWGFVIVGLLAWLR